MATVIVKEGDGHSVQVAWKDGLGAAVTPTTCRYRIDCITTGLTALDWQDVAAAPVLLIDIPGSANAILANANESEVKQITVQANHGQPNQKTVVGEYVVPNNDFVS